MHISTIILIDLCIYVDRASFYDSPICNFDFLCFFFSLCHESMLLMYNLIKHQYASLLKIKQVDEQHSAAIDSYQDKIKNRTEMNFLLPTRFYRCSFASANLWMSRKKYRFVVHFHALICLLICLRLICEISLKNN